jgi:hypothetical protein
MVKPTQYFSQHLVVRPSEFSKKLSMDPSVEEILSWNIYCLSTKEGVSHD